MPSVNRRDALWAGAVLAIPPGLATLIAGCSRSGADPSQQAKSDAEENRETQESNPPAAAPTSGELMKIQYLEIVTPEVDGLVRQYSAIYGITFSEPNAGFGGARTAELDRGGWIGIRGPLRDTETPVVRPYVLVDDIKEAVESAADAGAEVAMGPTEIPEQGTFAIVIHGGIECGFWQN